MQDFVAVACRMRDQVAKERAIRFVAFRPFGCADEVEGAPERRGGKEVVVDVGDHRQPIALGQLLERGRDIGKLRQAGERIEISLDQT